MVDNVLCNPYFYEMRRQNPDYDENPFNLKCRHKLKQLFQSGREGLVFVEFLPQEVHPCNSF